MWSSIRCHLLHEHQQANYYLRTFFLSSQLSEWTTSTAAHTLRDPRTRRAVTVQTLDFLRMVLCGLDSIVWQQKSCAIFRLMSTSEKEWFKYRFFCHISKFVAGWRCEDEMTYLEILPTSHPKSSSTTRKSKMINSSTLTPKTKNRREKVQQNYDVEDVDSLLDIAEDLLAIVKTEWSLVTDRYNAHSNELSRAIR